jgi:3-oxoacyl-(acyl-carrier-protein) synthase
LQKRVVVTGMGVVSSIGQDLDTFFNSLCAGKSGISLIESFDVTDWSTQIAGEVKDFDPGQLVSKKMARRLDRSIMFSLVAGKKALLDAGLPTIITCVAWSTLESSRRPFFRSDLSSMNRAQPVPIAEHLPIALHAGC